MNFGSALEQVHRRAPLVDCITNFVTVNDCANILLAVGGSPTMASDIRNRPGCWTPCSLRSSGAMRRRFALWPSAGRRAAAWT